MPAATAFPETGSSAQRQRPGMPFTRALSRRTENAQAVTVAWKGLRVGEHGIAHRHVDELGGPGNGPPIDRELDLRGRSDGREGIVGTCRAMATGNSRDLRTTLARCTWFAHRGMMVRRVLPDHHVVPTTRLGPPGSEDGRGEQHQSCRSGPPYKLPNSLRDHKRAEAGTGLTAARHKYETGLEKTVTHVSRTRFF